MFVWKKLSNYVFLAAALVLVFVTPAASEVTRVGFREALHTVLRADNELQVRRAEIATQRERVQDSIRNYFPDLSLDLKFLEGVKGGAIRPTGDPLSTSRMDLVQPVWTGERLSGVYAQNIAGLQSAKMDYYILAQEKMVETAEVYLELLRQQLNIESQENLLVQAREAYDLVKKQYERGLTTWRDLLEVRRNMNDVRSDLAEYYHGREAQRYELNRLMDRSIDSELRVRRQRFTIGDTAPDPVERSKIDREVKKMFAHSYQLRKLESELKYYRQGVDLARANYLPEINFEANYTSKGENILGTEQGEDYYAGLNMKMFIFGHSFESSARRNDAVEAEPQDRYSATINFFDNSPDIITTPISARQSVKNVGSLDIQTQQAETRLETARIDLESQRENSEVSFRSLYNDLSQSRLLIKHGLETVEFHEENVKILKRQQEAGTATVLDLLKALVNRENARIDLIENWYNYYLTDFRIDLETGRVAPTVEL